VVGIVSPCAPPEVTDGRPMQVVRAWDVTEPQGIGEVRRQMTRILMGAAPPDHDGATKQDGATDPGGLVELRNRVALSCSELVTNALRHGQLPIAVRLLTDGTSWMLDVTDAATDRLPDPTTQRPLGHGGYGLMLVARLASQLGWYIHDDTKHVWARIEMAPDQDLVDQLAGR
jgi:hypothetical protein